MVVQTAALALTAPLDRLVSLMRGGRAQMCAAVHHREAGAGFWALLVGAGGFYKWGRILQWQWKVIRDVQLISIISVMSLGAVVGTFIGLR